MTQKDIQDYLDKGIYGPNQLKPEEQKKYLGTFRERVLFIINLNEAETKRYDVFCINKFTDYPNGTLLINANCPPTVQNHFIKLAQGNNIIFRLVDVDEQKLTPDAIAIVFSDSKPTNLEDISVKETVSKKEADKIRPTEKPQQKEHFLKRFFKF